MMKNVLCFPGRIDDDKHDDENEDMKTQEGGGARGDVGTMEEGQRRESKK